MRSCKIQRLIQCLQNSLSLYVSGEVVAERCLTTQGSVKEATSCDVDQSSVHQRHRTEHSSSTQETISVQTSQSVQESSNVEDTSISESQVSSVIQESVLVQESSATQFTSNVVEDSSFHKLSIAKSAELQTSTSEKEILSSHIQEDFSSVQKTSSILQQASTNKVSLDEVFDINTQKDIESVSDNNQCIEDVAQHFVDDVLEGAQQEISNRLDDQVIDTLPDQSNTQEHTLDDYVHQTEVLVEQELNDSLQTFADNLQEETELDDQPAHAEQVHTNQTHVQETSVFEIKSEVPVTKSEEPTNNTPEDSVQQQKLDNSIQQVASNFQQVTEANNPEVQSEEVLMNQAVAQECSAPVTVSETKSEEKSESIETKEEDVTGGHIKETEFRSQSNSDYAKTEISGDGTTQITKEQQIQSVRVVREITVTENETDKLEELLESRMRLIPGAPYTSPQSAAEVQQEQEPVPEIGTEIVEPGKEERAIDVPSIEPGSDIKVEVIETQDEKVNIEESVRAGEENSDKTDDALDESIESPTSGNRKEKGGFFSFFKRKTARDKSKESDGETSPISPQKEPKSPKKEKKKKDKKLKKDKKDKTPEPDLILTEENDGENATLTIGAEAIPVETGVEKMSREGLVEVVEGECKKSEVTQQMTEIKVKHEQTSTLEPGSVPPTESQDDMSIQVERKEEYLSSDAPKSFTLPIRHHTAGATTTAAAPLSPQPDPCTSTRASQMLAPINSHDASFDGSVDSGTVMDPTRTPGHFVVVAIDFGTTFSGYAFSFTRDPESIHMMRKWEGGDPGVINQKTPTCLLLTPDGKFHSFGFNARDFFHDLDPQEAKKWLYFEKFKMLLHYNAVSIFYDRPL